MRNKTGAKTEKKRALQTNAPFYLVILQQELLFVCFLNSTALGLPLASRPDTLQSVSMDPVSEGIHDVGWDQPEQRM